MLDPVGLILAALGVTALAASVLPRLLGRVPVSMPMVFLTEVCVIISLMGAGLVLPDGGDPVPKRYSVQSEVAETKILARSPR